MACLKNRIFNCSTGDQIRDFIHIDDVIRAIFKLIKSKKSIGQIFNIGSGKPVKVKSVIEQIRKISKGGFPQYGKIKLRKDEIKKLYPSITKAKKILNWMPKVKINLGLKKTINYYKKNG